MFFFKIKKHIWILLFYTCIIILNLDDMIYSSWDIECDGLKLVIMGHFLPFYTLWSEADWIFYHFGPFSPFYPPPPLTTQKIKILKKWKKASRDTIIQYTWCVPKIMIIWCMLPEIWSVTHNFLSFWAILFPFVSLKTLKIEIWKNIKKTWRYYPFTHVYHKWRSYDVSFLKYKAWERVFLSFWTIFCTLTLTTQKIKIL